MILCFPFYFLKAELTSTPKTTFDLGIIIQHPVKGYLAPLFIFTGFYSVGLLFILAAEFYFCLSGFVVYLSALVKLQPR